MADVYVVMDLDYDGNDVVGVFLDQAAAEAFIAGRKDAEKGLAAPYPRVYEIQHWAVAGSASSRVGGGWVP